MCFVSREAALLSKKPIAMNNTSQTALVNAISQAKVIETL